MAKTGWPGRSWAGQFWPGASIGDGPTPEPPLSGVGTWADQIVEQLEAMGYGYREYLSITDMERLRLLDKLSLTDSQPLSMMDLYYMADEPARIYGIKEK